MIFRAWLARVVLVLVLGAGAALLGFGGRDGVIPVAATSAALQLDAAQQGPPLPDVVQDGGMRKSGTLSAQLDELYRIDLLNRQMGRSLTSASTLTPVLEGMKSARTLRVDEAGGVQVYVVTSAQPDTVMDELAALGMRVERVSEDGRTIQGNLPIASLEAAAAVPGVTAVREPDYPAVNAGSVTTQGDAIIHTDALRSALGVDGSGVKVGVISDGLAGLATSQGSGDLPSVDSTTCNVTGQNPTAAAAGGEGTAILEIVHDIAPGAELSFGYFGLGTQNGGTSVDFIAAVNCLAAHVDVVVDDISFFNNGPYDGTSPISVNASNALRASASPIRAYYTSVGNYAGNHYEEPYLSSGAQVTGSTPGDFWTLHGFAATSSTTSAGRPIACPSASAYSCGDQVAMLPGGILTVTLEWNDPFGQSANDYDLMFRDETTGMLYLGSANRQQGAGSDPTESFAIQNPYQASVSNFDIVIGNYRGAAATRTFNMFVRCSGCQALTSSSVNVMHNFNTASGSVPNNGDAGGGVVSLGAINQLTGLFEPFSSEGPTADGRTKPDAMAPDRISVTGAGGFTTTFAGTSAAAPHAAGMAALLLSCDPALLKGSGSGTRANLARNALHTAVAGTGALLQLQYYPPNTYGIGMINALEAAGPAQCRSEMQSMMVAELRGVAALGVDDVYVIDGCAIREFVRGVQRRVVGPQNCGELNPEDIAVDTSGDVYVADSAYCRVVKIHGGVMTTLAGSSPPEIQRCYYGGDGGSAGQASFGYPTSVAVDGDGSVFVLDYQACRIREIKDGMVATVAGTGACSNAGDGGPATAAGIRPYAVRLDGAGNMYIASGCAVREVTAGMISTYAGDSTGWGNCDASGDGGPATEATFTPASIGTDSAGDLFVADAWNCNVRKVVPGGTISTVAGIGKLQPGLSCSYNGFNGYTGAALSTAISPDKVAIDPAGTLYISEFRPFDTTTDGIVRIVRPVDRDLDGYSDAREAALGTSEGTFCPIMWADVTGDGAVNGIDLVAFAQTYLQSVPPAPARVDLTGDGVVNGLDLAAFAGVFTRSVSDCP